MQGKRTGRVALLLTAAATLVLGAWGCKAGPRDVAPPRVIEITAAEIPPSRPGGPQIAITRTAVLARARTRALATDTDAVFFGNEAANVLDVVPKHNGPITTLGRPAPQAIAIGQTHAFWIGAPGTSIHRIARGAWQTPEVVREKGTFTAIAARGDDLYVAELVGEGGIVTRNGAQVVARFGSPPLSLALDDVDVFVQTPAVLGRAPRFGGDAVSIATGAFSKLAIDDRALYAIDLRRSSHALVHVSKNGGPITVLEHAVRDAPIAAYGGELFYFDADQPTLRRVSNRGGASTVVARRDELAHVTALVVDESGIFVAVEDERGGASGMIIAMPRPLPGAL